MKNKYLFILSLVSSFAFAQQTISFEASEGFTLGSIHGQNGWEVTLNSDDNPIKNQTISTEQAFDGTQSLKIDVDMDENFGWFPIFGAAKLFDTTYNYQNTTIEFDVFVTEKEGSSFDFGAFGITNTDEFMPVSIFAFNATGILEVVKNEDYQYEDVNYAWDANRWYKLKSVITENDIKFYVDGTLVHTMPNFSKVDIAGVNFVHDNFAGSAYIDNLKINDEVMAVNDATKGNIKLYPNPVKDILKLNLPNGEKISTIEVYNTLGQKVSDFSNMEEINLKQLKAGVYIINLKNNKGKTYSSKIVKQ
ncbi:T9SS type A sorting domain-containing protein [Epilithonimonas xixisoli]|uniref:Putative secreted protein (Por secretion system target) n=1 Tax=Epilithonimonas xixisoli TaxID=1476462 RepID=A0A4R8IA86_9FLAO|nr:T9SS type A sorting domain-containing protein [Epilithonimonas xixisoli]TDX86450.1 putative secreted protein (Por secretion system target) [Epilithonimonas xixisoli]